MIRYIKYLSPFLIIVAIILTSIFYPISIPIPHQLPAALFYYLLLILSIYWGVGIWIPREMNRVFLSVLVAVIALFVASMIASPLAALLIPFILFAMLGVKRHYS